MINQGEFARQFRPSQFVDVIGQNRHVQSLVNNVKNNSIRHGLLFVGPPGVGKTTLARIVAKSLNCQNLKDGYEPCDQCPSCLDVKEEKFNRNIFMIDAASNRGVDSIDKLKGSIHSIPMYGDKRKIFIFDEAHRLSATAFDSFLTVLEEPPKHAYFMFCTTEGKKVLPTIKSRCMNITLTPLKEPEVATRLAQILDRIRETRVSKSEMATLMRVANASFGCMRDAISILESLYFNDALEPEKANDYIPKFDESSLSQCILWLISKNPSLLVYIDSLEEQKDFEAFFFQMRRIIKNTLLVKLNATLSEPDWVIQSSKKNAQALTNIEMIKLIEIFNFDFSFYATPKDHLFTKLAEFYLEFSKGVIQLQPSQSVPLPPPPPKK